MTKPAISEQPSPPVNQRASVARLAADYLAGFFVGLIGVRVVGWRWLSVLAFYLVHPVVGRLWAGRVITLNGIRIRLGECDLTVLVNLFRDYNVSVLKQWLPDAEIVVDAGANIGAFSYLVKVIAPAARVIALEPDSETFEFLVAQPFCKDIDCRLAALGPVAGRAALKQGTNSVTHEVDFTQTGAVEVVTLESIATAPTLLKLDIEGAERAILTAGIPDAIGCVLMEWHFADSPKVLFPEGTLHQEHTTPYGQTTWSWVRDNSA
jgi:FkbM family methyltransferase